jgi:hypothetical protein
VEGNIFPRRIKVKCRGWDLEMQRVTKIKIKITKGIQQMITLIILTIQTSPTKTICLNSRTIKTTMALKISRCNQQMAMVMMEAKAENLSKMKKVLNLSTRRRVRKNKQLEVSEWFQHRQMTIKMTTSQTNQSL